MYLCYMYVLNRVIVMCKKPLALYLILGKRIGDSVSGRIGDTVSVFSSMPSKHKGCGWGKIYELSSIGASFWLAAPSFFMPSASFWSKWSISFKATCSKHNFDKPSLSFYQSVPKAAGQGKPRGPKTIPCLLSPQTGSGATKTCPILFFHFPKKDSGPPRNACQKLEKLHSALQSGNGQDRLHLGTLKKGSHSMSSIMQTSCL